MQNRDKSSDSRSDSVLVVSYGAIVVVSYGAIVVVSYGAIVTVIRVMGRLRNISSRTCFGLREDSAQTDTLQPTVKVMDDISIIEDFHYLSSAYQIST